MSTLYPEPAEQFPSVAVSVVIPVFDVAPYLRRCLASICGQTLRDIEIICVNDASTDASLDILREYAARDERITVIDLCENRGVAFARNLGIEAAQGEYLSFVDPDDYVDPDFYEKLYTLAYAEKPDIVKGSIIIINEHGNAVHQLINDCIRKNKFKFSHQHTTAIYSRKLLWKNKIRYPDGLSNNEDGVFLLKAAYFADKIETIDTVHYIYKRRPGSLTFGQYSISQWHSMLTSFELMIDFINTYEVTPEDYDAVFWRCFSSCCNELPFSARPEDAERAFKDCAETAIKLYRSCKYREALDARFSARFSAWREYLLMGDAGRLADYLRLHKTRPGKELCAAANNKPRSKIRPKVSVIIPAYKTAPYLRRCLDSVCGQTLREIEILCVNDASPDNALEIMCEYAACDHRMTVIDFSHNRGVSAARNAAIGMAGGEYLGFVDSDDAIEPDFYEKLYAKAAETGALIAKGVLLRISEDGDTRLKLINEKVRENRFHFTYQWTTAIYQTEFIRKNSINCPLDVIVGQDIVFLLKAVALVSDVVTVDDACYCYYRRHDSADSNKLNYEKFLSVLKAYEDIVAFINTCEVTPEDYSAVFWQRLLRCEELLPRTYSKDAERAFLACAETMIKLYCSCKYREALDARLAARFSAWHKYLLMGDAGGLADYLRLPKPSARKPSAREIAAALRCRLAAAKGR
jgi:glycosyltransferase involved in cell wall biosynthesis